MTKFEDSNFLKAVRKEPVPVTPIWIMRQAGRYLKEYQNIRNKHSFLTVCKTPELATEVTLQPIRKFGFDAAILFSDILVIPEAMGMNLEFTEGNGPLLSPQITTKDQLDKLSVEHLEDRLSYVADAVKSIVQALCGKTPLIGFSGSPFTLATYMIEGKPTRNFKFVKTMMYSDPFLLDALLQKLTKSIVKYLKMQIEAGVQAIQLFDTWASILPPHIFAKYSAQYLNEILKEIKPYGVPVILFCKGGISIFKELLKSDAEVLGVDWLTNMEEALTLSDGKFALQGNLDPTILYGNKSIIKNEVERILKIFNGKPGHIFNLGHGILPDVPEDNVKYLVEIVREISRNIIEKSK